MAPYRERVVALAEETAQDLFDKVKKHPILARCLTEEQECLLQLLLFDFNARYTPCLKPAKIKALLFLVQENHFSLLYPCTYDPSGYPIKDKIIW